ncbi:aminoglycoside phosphotransferase family protein [Amycolatopsis sp. WQ 127309]|uniref:aminoglycoside phosphotransferase family protein n=1 Tax=Amycolatopsis sp. WQ 127309 TaxID=2932773 RepID=UPI001FF20AA9|nr:aminoglycoside phosphotransferase family protein [Amycolatopsis sp. WQ 127309]UOZ04325.1 aminoglycoside phosphotransferase family protein [Amycolatopsis sp. WQ 127309]
MTAVLDDAARARLVTRFGADVADPWCDALPDLVDRLAARWGLEVREARPGNTGRTLLCTDPDGDLQVLKLTPDSEIARLEAAGLRAWTGCRRAVQLLDTDLDAGAILLEGLVPGTELRGRDVPWAEIGDLLTQLHSVAPPADLPSLTDRVTFMYDITDRTVPGSAAEPHLTRELLARARNRALALAATGGPVAVVHGDLHPGNVLDAGPDRGVVAIDPRPSVGDPAMDAVDWAFLPMAAGGTIDDGITLLAPHVPHLDAERVHAWCVALAPLLAHGPLRRGEHTPFTDALLQMAR